MNLSQTLEAARNVLRFKHMAYKTEQSYLGWIRRYAYWCKDNQGGSHEDKVRGYLTHLATDRNVSASTQNQALNAIVFLYRHVLQEDVGDFSGFHPARQPRRLPVVLTRDEVGRLLSHLTGMQCTCAKPARVASIRPSAGSASCCSAGRRTAGGGQPRSGWSRCMGS